MTPIVDGLAAAYEGQIVFKRFNAITGDGPAVMETYRIPGHPTTLVFNKEGQEVQRFIGPQSSETMVETLETVLSD